MQVRRGPYGPPSMTASLVKRDENEGDGVVDLSWAGNARESKTVPSMPGEKDG